MAPHYYHIACVLWLMYQVPLIMASEANNITSRFYCQADRKYIDDLKICNFIQDCSDGEDESQCGSCRWTRDEHATETTICGLRISYSAALEVHSGQVVMGISRELAKIHGEKPINSLLVSPSSDVIALIEHHKSLDVNGTNVLIKVHQINIEFPRLRPTDREDCEMSLLLYASDKPSLPAVGNITELYERWPQVSIYVVEPNKVELVEQSTLGQYVKWFELHVRIGQRVEDFWQPRIKFETKIDTSAIYIGPIMYRNCEPKNVTALEIAHKRPATSAEWDQELKGKCNQTNKFLCKLTGQCIDQKLVCDFGHDCGPDDDSDEADCSDYEGRCDFESLDRCGWISTNDSWLWVDPNAATDQASVDMRNMPKVDHTYQTNGSGGHYMLLNEKLLDEINMAQLFGPQVQLKPGHEECRIRFWLSTQENLTELSSPYLVAGFEHIRAPELFNAHEPGEAGWRRFDLLLLQKGLDRPSQSTLHIKFGNMTKDLAKFRQNGGYLALDDLSFTTGCQLTYNQYEEKFCPPNQFECSLAPLETSTQTYCVFRDRLCNFKPDCSFGPKRPLSPGVPQEGVQVEPIKGDEETRFYVGRPFLMILVLAFIVVVAATFINNRRLNAYRRMAKGDSDQIEGLVMSRIQGESG